MVEKQPCRSCDTPTSSGRGFCTHCQKAGGGYPAERPDFGEHADLAGVYERNRRRIDASGATGRNRSNLIHVVNQVAGLEVSNRTPSRAIYAHPELNELAEMTHHMRYGRGVDNDPRWLPSPMQDGS